MFDSLNHTLFLLINAQPDSPAWAIGLGVLLAKRVIYLLPPMLTAMWLWGNSAQRNTALKGLVVTAIALGFNQLIGIGIPTQRPFELALGHTFLTHAATASFPSNHLTIFLCVGLCALLGSTPRLGVIVLLSGAVVAWARIFVGVHFPLDMAGAVLISTLTYMAVTPLWNRHGLMFTRRLENLYRHALRPAIAAGWLRH